MANVGATNGQPVNVGKLVGGGGSPKADFTSRISSANELSFSKVEWVAGQALLPGHQPHALVEVDVARGGKDALKIRYDGETNTWSSVRPLKDGGEFSRVLTPSERDAFAKLIDGYQKVQAKRKGGTTKPLHEVATQRLAAALASDRPLGRTEFNSLKTAAGIAWAAPLVGQAAVEKAKEKGPAKKENGQGKATPPAVDALKVSERQQTVLKLLEKEYDFLANVKPSDYTERLQGTTSNFLKNVEKDVKGMKGDAQQLLGKIIMLHAQKSAPTVLSAEQVTLAGMLMGRVSELEKLTGQQYSSSLSSVTDGLLSKAHSKLAGTNLSSVNEAIKSLEELHKKLLAERLKHKEAKSTPVAATTQAPAFIGPPFEPKDAGNTETAMRETAAMTLGDVARTHPSDLLNNAVAPPVVQPAASEPPAAPPPLPQSATIQSTPPPLDSTVSNALSNVSAVKLNDFLHPNAEGGFRSNQTSIRINDLIISFRDQSWLVESSKQPERKLQPHELDALASLVESKLNGAGKKEEMRYWQAAKELIAEHRAELAAAAPKVTPTVPPSSTTVPSQPSFDDGLESGA